MSPSPLWLALTQTTDRAFASGALRKIPTNYAYLEHDRARFLVRSLANLQRKDKAKKQQDARGPDFNPFLPFEEELFVAELPPSHVALLNKFNVVDHHLLIITRHFEEQTALLTLEDFIALCAAMAEIDGLAFYNGGEEAGASQRHKHLQVVPLPLVEGERDVPITAFFGETTQGQAPLPYPNYLVNLQAFEKTDPETSATHFYAAYRTAMRALNLWGAGVQTNPYNLIATRDWLMVIPRKQEVYEGIAVNALGFAGTFLVRDEALQQVLGEIGPLNLLAQVAGTP